jgi:hypothetical protein
MLPVIEVEQRAVQRAGEAEMITVLLVESGDSQASLEPGGALAASQKNGASSEILSPETPQ